jgi:hypothetical protein
MLYLHSNIHGISSVIIMKVCTPQRWNTSILSDCVHCNSSVCYRTSNDKVTSLQIMKPYRGPNSFLPLAWDGVKWPASRLGHSIRKEGTRWCTLNKSLGWSQIRSERLWEDNMFWPSQESILIPLVAIFWQAYAVLHYSPNHLSQYRQSGPVHSTCLVCH